MYKFLVLFFLVTLLACDKRELPTEIETASSFTIEKHILPAYINPGKSYSISVKINSESLIEINTITLNIIRLGESTPTISLILYDDGGATFPDDRDVVAYDGIFTNVLIWDPPSNNREEYNLNFEAQASGQNITLVETVVSLDNVPPRILLIDIAESLVSGFDEELIRVEAADSNGTDDIDKVQYKGVRNDTLYFEGELNKSPELPPTNNEALTFSQAIDSTFAIGKKGEYDIIFEAIDKSNNHSSPQQKSVIIENNAPKLFNVGGPAEFERPNNVDPNKIATDNFLLTTNVNDEQSIADIKSVTLLWQKPDGTYSNNSPFLMFDNGLPFKEDFSGWSVGYRGDLIAGDGIYSITALFDENQPLGDYTLTMYAEDFAGNKSAEIIHIIKLKDNE
jgi:hypothetical protein